MSEPYDVAFLNATIADGSGGEPRIADVAIRGDRIELVGDFRGRARRYVDVFGKVLAPGFVDMHSHSDYSLLSDALAHSKVRQGVTTEVGGNCGYHAAPVAGAVAEERRAEYGRIGLAVDWTTSAEYIAAIEKARPSVNYAQQIGYNTLRSAVATDRAKALSPEERERLRALVRAELANGYVGLSYGIAYSPACFSTTEELIDVAMDAAEADAIITFHIRNEDAQLIESLEEALTIGRASGARTHIGHLKTFRRPNWHKIDRALELLDTARAEGMSLSVDRYPHLAMNTQLKFALPTWVLDGGISETKARLRDPETRAKIVGELEGAHGDEAREVLIALVGRNENRHLEGKFLDDIAGSRNTWEVLCEILAEEGDSIFATFFGMSRENLDRILKLDYSVVASDASIQAIQLHAGGGRPHPRCFDTFPYFLAEWVFARGEIALGEAIRKMTSMPAERCGLRERGRIAEGWFADVVVLDRAALCAEVSYEDPIKFASGIDLVMVNGEIVVEQGRHTGARSGRFLRRERPSP